MSVDLTRWMPRERWDALVRGEGCPVCVELQANEDVNARGYNIADLQVSRLQLQLNQYVKGYCLLVANEHVREPYELNRADQQSFFQDLLLAGQAIEQAVGALKMNFYILGNSIPHLHCHLVPRYYGDPAPYRTINWEEQRIVLTDTEYRERVELIREHLSELR
ncbi:MAG TPA: HIT family protein [Thermomicrobiaceae bacterium]|nr:HIT family protein [Thermomicrobiaceae bacterium]